MNYGPLFCRWCILTGVMLGLHGFRTRRPSQGTIGSTLDKGPLNVIAKVIVNVILAVMEA